VLGDWVELPLVNPLQIKLARVVKCALTGDLENEVRFCIPPFKMKEAHYLKAQIVRIAFNTQIAPTGVYKLSETQGTLR